MYCYWSWNISQFVICVFISYLTLKRQNIRQCQSFTICSLNQIKYNVYLNVRKNSFSILLYYVFNSKKHLYIIIVFDKTCITNV